MEDAEKQSLRTLAKPEIMEPTIAESDVTQEALTWLRIIYSTAGLSFCTMKYGPAIQLF